MPGGQSAVEVDPISIMSPVKPEATVIVVTLGTVVPLVPEAPGPSPTTLVPVGNIQFAPELRVMVPAGSRTIEEGAGFVEVKPLHGLAAQLLLEPGLIPRASMTPAPLGLELRMVRA
jgi:hypothetical protein